MTLYTLGHGTRLMDELVTILREAHIRRLVDVRRYPGSRTQPHFARESLRYALLAAGIVYEGWHDELGGRRTPQVVSRHSSWQNRSLQAYADYMDTPQFHRALERLLEVAGRGPLVAILCAETLWWRCHRRLIADALVTRGCNVCHLMSPGLAKPHSLTPFLRVTAKGDWIYDRAIEDTELNFTHTLGQEIL